MTAVSEVPALAKTRRSALAERFGSLRQWILLAPGLAWLVAFFVLPLVLIFIVSLGHRDELDRVVLSNPSFDNYARAIDPRFVPTLLNSLRYAALTTILSLADRLPAGLLDQPLRRAPQGTAPDPCDAAVLDQLPHPDLRLDDHAARQRRRELDPSGRRNHVRTDHPAQHRLLGRARHDLRLPAVRDPAAVRLDRPAGPGPRRGGTRPVREWPAGVPPRDAATDDAGHHRGRASSRSFRRSGTS